MFRCEMVLLVMGFFFPSTPAPLFGAETRGACCGACCTLLCGAPSRESAPSSTMAANAADLVPAVEAYLEANGLKETLSAMKAEAKAKNMTPSKTVRGDPRGRAPRFARAARTVADAPKKNRPDCRPLTRPDDDPARPRPSIAGEKPRRGSHRDGERVHGGQVRLPRRARARRPPSRGGRPTAGTHRRHAPTHRRRRRVADDDRIGSDRSDARPRTPSARALISPPPPSLRSSRARSQGHEAQGRG